jgi:hypothetical protein
VEMRYKKTGLAAAREKSGLGDAEQKAHKA